MQENALNQLLFRLLPCKEIVISQQIAILHYLNFNCILLVSLNAFSA